MATGEEIVRIAETRKGDPYVLGSPVPKNNSQYRGPWDCAEFASWCVFQVSQKLYGCEDDSANPAKADAYTGFWSRDADRVGKKISLEEAARTPGALVLRVPQANLTGHIVISDGAGGTIEAHSSADGVIKGSSATDGIPASWCLGFDTPAAAAPIPSHSRPSCIGSCSR